MAQISLLERVQRLNRDLGQFRKAMDAQSKAIARLRKHLDA